MASMSINNKNSFGPDSVILDAINIRKTAFFVLKQSTSIILWIKTGKNKGIE